MEPQRSGDLEVWRRGLEVWRACRYGGLEGGPPRGLIKGYSLRTEELLPGILKVKSKNSESLYLYAKVFDI
jgi:hypothetical protein